MSLVTLFIISSVVALGGRIFSKLCSNNVAGQSKAKYTLFLIVNGLVACLFFWISSGFHLALNLTTLLYSIAYALIVTVALVSNLMVYKFATISGVSILSSTFGLTGSLMLGFLLFDENIGMKHVLRVLIMLVATFLVFLDNKKREAPPNLSKGGQKNSTLKKLAVLSAMILSGLANTILTKSFANSKNVTDDNSFFFFTNAFIVLGALVIFFMECRKHREQFREAIALLKPKRLISLSGNTICSNVGSLVGLQIIAQMEVSVYSPISSAIGIFLALVGSWVFRERLGILSYLAAAIACVAVIL